MPRWNTFFQITIYICALIIIVTLAITFINGLNIFVDVESSHNVEDTSNNVLQELTGFTGGFEYIWTSIILGSGLGTLVVAKLTQSTNMIGVWLFSGVFWTSYNKCMSVVNINNFIPNDFLLIFTAALLFLWVAAIIGMLTGSG